MQKIVAIAFIIAGLMSGVVAQESGAFVSYSDALAKCSAEWKQSEARRNVVKGMGVDAWNDFRRKCVVEKGYVKGRKADKKEG